MLGGTHEFKRIVSRVHLVRDVLITEEWCDASGSFPRTGPAVAAALAAAAETAAAARVATAALAAARAHETPDEAAAREMEEEEALACGAYIGGQSTAPPPADTMAVDLETEAAGMAREAAPLRFNRFDPQLRVLRSSRGWTLSELEIVVPASRAEIVSELKRLGAACFADGRWVLIAERYAGLVLGDILRAMEAEGWTLGSVPLGLLCDSLDQHARSIIEAVIRHHSDDEVEGGSGSGVTNKDSAITLSPTKVMISRARALLANARAEALSSGSLTHGSWAVFLAAWTTDIENIWPSSSSIPSVNADLLRNIVYYVVPPPMAPPGAQKTHFHYFPADELPAEPAPRFAALFKARATWGETEFLPFVEALAAPPHRKLMDLVATFCRVSIGKDKSRSFSKK